MLFNSLEFFVFFPVVTTLYYFVPHRDRWVVLLLAGCIFYMAFVPAYILILALLIVTDYALGRQIEAAPPRFKRLWLGISLTANLGVLFLFKYFNFLNASLGQLAQAVGWTYPVGQLNLILPIGLSFHTFQSLSYIIEVYRGRYPAERHLGLYAVYVLFFPQLVAGPIERPQNLLPQVHAVHQLDYGNITTGLKQMAWGFFKKLVIADRLAIAVNQVYGNPHAYSGVALSVATVFFAYQIYCDFSGYSDIARGAARVLGFHLTLNFDRPYATHSIVDFWHRWHISLSSWFRDYCYIPLGGNRTSRLRQYANLLITFLVSGLWHGANWTFVIWGALHGSYLIGHHMTATWPARLTHRWGLARWPRLKQVGQVGLTFALVCFAWIFFRANTVTEAWYIATHLFSGLGSFVRAVLEQKSLVGLGLGLGSTDLMVALVAIGIMEIVQAFHARESWVSRLARQPAWARWGLYYGLLLSVLLFGKFNRSAFIYFQF